MALLAQSADYTDRDFDSLELRLQNLVKSVFPEWTDFNVANFGNILLNLFAFVGDVLTYYQDNQAGESRIATATQRKAMLGLVKLIGYEPTGASAASTDLTFTLDAVPSQDVIISAGTIVSTEAVTDPISFQLLEDVEIVASSDPPEADGTVENSEDQEDSFESDGLANQEFELSATPYLDDSAVISAANGTYTEVSNFLDSTTTDRHFTIIVDQNDRATARFGNGTNGVIPSGTITISYKTGGGTTGNVNAGTITKIDGTFTDILGVPVVVTVNNANAASGGTNRQTIEQIRTLAPLTLRVLNRTVTREDFEINALRVSGVARALMLTSNEDISIAENAGILYVIPTGGGTPSSTLKASVLTMVTVTYPSTLTFSVSVQNPVYKTINVDATVYLTEGASETLVGSAVRTALTEFFAVSQADGTPNPNVDFGFNIKDVSGDPVPEIAWSDIFNVVRDTTGIRKIGDQDDDFLLNGYRQDVSFTVKEFPILGTVTLRNGDTGNPF